MLSEPKRLVFSYKAWPLSLILLSMMLSVTASAVNLNPGGTVSLNGVAGPAGTVISDPLIDFEVRDPLGVIVLTGRLQDRVLRDNTTGQLSFIPRVRDLNVQGTSNFNYRVIRVDKRGFGGFSTDVDFSTTSVGDIGPPVAQRDSTGDTVTFSFDPTIGPPFSSRFFFISTPARQFDKTGQTVITLQDANSGQITSVTLGETNAPAISVTLTTDTTSINENGGRAGLTARLDVISTVPVTVNLGFSGSALDNIDYEKSTASIVVPSGKQSNTATINALDDPIDEPSETIEVAVVSVVNAAELDEQQVAIKIVDDDSAAVLVTPTSGLVTSENGVADTFTVRLDSEPTNDVVINLSSSNVSEGTVAPTSLRFTPTDWNKLKTVNVTGVNDDIADGNRAYRVLTAAAISEDSAYNGINPADVTVSNLDNDAIGITVAPTSGLQTTEVGGTATFTVRLDSQPVENVVINLSSSDVSEGVVGPASLTFSVSDWNSPKSVSVTGVNDNIVDGNRVFNIVTAPAISADEAYGGLNAPDVSVTNLDDDVASIIVNVPGEEGVITDENGTPVQFEVALTSEPVAPVSIDLSSTDASEGGVNPARLVFTSQNWNQPQSVTVTGRDDDVADGDQSYRIVTSPAVSADVNYDELNGADVNATTLDDEVAGFTVQPTSGLTTSENGDQATFTIVLNTEPTADVDLTLNSDDVSEGIVNRTSLRFTQQNWNQPQTVTVSGQDENTADGDQEYRVVINSAVSGDDNYQGLNPVDVQVVNLDNDTVRADIIVGNISGFATNESGADIAFTLSITRRPTADVTIGLSSSDASEASISPSSVVFTPNQWDVGQRVVVTGMDDDEIDGDTSYEIITAPAGSLNDDYNGLNPADLMLINRDDGEPTQQLLFRSDFEHRESSAE